MSTEPGYEDPEWRVARRRAIYSNQEIFGQWLDQCILAVPTPAGELFCQWLGDSSSFNVAPAEAINALGKALRKIPESDAPVLKASIRNMVGENPLSRTLWEHLDLITQQSQGRAESVATLESARHEATLA